MGSKSSQKMFLEVYKNTFEREVKLIDRDLAKNANYDIYNLKPWISANSRFFTINDDYTFTLTKEGCYYALTGHSTINKNDLTDERIAVLKDVIKDHKICTLNVGDYLLTTNYSHLSVSIVTKVDRKHNSFQTKLLTEISLTKVTDDFKLYNHRNYDRQHYLSSAEYDFDCHYEFVLSADSDLYDKLNMWKDSGVKWADMRFELMSYVVEGRKSRGLKNGRWEEDIVLS